jgi:predicted SprT family Zn-dependent metalloprotease
LREKIIFPEIPKKIVRSNTRKEETMFIEVAEIKALELMAQHGLVQNGVKFGFHTSRRAAQYNPKTNTISLLEGYVELNEWEPFLKNSVLHEIAHYFFPPIRVGRQWKVHHHLWREKFISIGGDGKRTASKDASFPEREERVVKTKYIAVCPCGREYEVKRKTKHFYHYSCPVCKSHLVFEEKKGCLSNCCKS